MWGQSWIWACYLDMHGDVECCLWFSWAFPLLDLHSHTKKIIIKKYEISIQLGLVMVSTVLGFVGHFTSFFTSLTFTHTLKVKKLLPMVKII